MLAESLAGLVQRPGRSLLTMLGTILGVGAFVTVLGFTSTATGQISASFSTLQASTVTVNDVEPTEGQIPTVNFPKDSDQRIERLNGVRAAGVWWPAPLHSPTIATRPLPPSEGGSNGMTVFAASPGALNALEPTLSTGTLYNEFHQRRGEPVCVLGSGAARVLGITRLDNRPVVFVNSTAYAVVGVVSDVQRMPESLLGVIIPTSTALKAFGPPVDHPAQMIIHTRLGAARLIAHQAPIALRPDNPRLLTAVPPPDPHSLRDAVNTSLSGLFLLLALICLVIGAVGIANTTLVAILERTGEIGLRRSLGARPRHIAVQFLTESTALGTLGGLIGTGIGVTVVVAVALLQEWTAVLDPVTVLPAPLVGSVVGLLAGLYPALRAARIEPLDALRQ
ncbi:ABC transporter permease [Streptomyces sp. NRRL B-24572]|uniref:ABC transporter permease n=1 Tax=Streptomyces sp. NRRL B-24572 TaxID=1962156 RepID=UPI00211AC279|nr:ABC transporter permease [Streptomyces sp. NRRL B-24572]